jgi:hypothetical protein
LNQHEITILDDLYCGRFPDGNYWLRPATGIWSIAGDYTPRGRIQDNCNRLSSSQLGYEGSYYIHDPSDWDWLDDTEPEKKTAYWNSWLQNQKSRPERLASLEVDFVKTYTFVLDLSPFDYSDFDIYTAGSVPVDPAFRKEIQRLIKEGDSRISLLIRPILMGTSLSLLSSEGEVNKAHHFGLARLKDPKRPTNKDLKELASNKISLEEFSRKVRAGVVRFDIQATEPGCKAIALSVWNGSGTQPLDHLVHEFSVHARGEKPPDCGIPDNPLRGGLKTLLTSMISGDANRRIEADASLHVFELR